VLGVIQDDIKHVHVRATAAVATAAVFVTQIPLEDLQAASEGARKAAVIGVLLLVFAGLLYFAYTQFLNRARLAIADAVANGDATAAVQAWRQRFMQQSTAIAKTREIWVYVAAQWLFVFGAAAVTYVLFDLIWP
jgi:hypothetical protein